MLDFCLFVYFYLEKKGILFLETSALESTNVEAAFNNVLAGNSF